MLKIQITDETLVDHPGSFEDANGKKVEYRRYGQMAYAHLPGKEFPVEFFLKLDPKASNSWPGGQGQKPYPKGQYILSPESFVVFSGKLVLARFVKLVPAQSGAASSTRAA